MMCKFKHYYDTILNRFGPFRNVLKTNTTKQDFLIESPESDYENCSIKWCFSCIYFCWFFSVAKINKLFKLKKIFLSIGPFEVFLLASLGCFYWPV